MVLADEFDQIVFGETCLQFEDLDILSKLKTLIGIEFKLDGSTRKQTVPTLLSGVSGTMLSCSDHRIVPWTTSIR